LPHKKHYKLTIFQGKRKREQANKDSHPPDEAAHSSSSSPALAVQSTEKHAVVVRNGRKPTLDCRIAPKMAELLLRNLAQDAHQSYLLGSPTSDHLLTLTRINVFRALAHNMHLIGWTMEMMDDDAISPFNLPMPQHSLPDQIPPTLQPTRLQKSVMHHPWLDFFPLPKMRDNLIEAGDDWDDEQLCADIMGFWNQPDEESGLLVWGEPWDVRSWEVTESFLKKWQWVVRGCPELMNSTNAWRARRGEKLIFRYL